MENNLRFSERLQELLIEKNLKCKDIAKSINVTEATVNRWKNGKILITLNKLIKLSDYFNCSLDFLVGRSDNVLDYTPKECPPFYMYFREFIKTKNISRNKINRETSIKSKHFVNWSKGQDPHILSLIELADYLDVTLDELVGRDR